jgi:hypothetical protein
VESERAPTSLSGRIFCGKPASTFPENALSLLHSAAYKVSQLLHVNFGGAWPGSTITALDSPQRPHFLTSLVGSLIMGLLAVATA